MIEGTTKKEPKKDVCHFAIVLEVMLQKWIPLDGAKSQERNKQAKQPQKDKRRRDNMREKFIKNKRPLNPTHIFFEKEKQLNTMTTRRIILMSQFNVERLCRRGRKDKRILQ